MYVRVYLSTFNSNQSATLEYNIIDQETGVAREFALDLPEVTYISYAKNNAHQKKIIQFSEPVRQFYQCILCPDTGILLQRSRLISNRL